MKPPPGRTFEAELARKGEHAVGGGTDSTVAARTIDRLLVRLRPQRSVGRFDESLQQPALPVVDASIVLPKHLAFAGRRFLELPCFAGCRGLKRGRLEPLHLLRVA